METINDRMDMLVNERFNGNKAAFAKAIGIERATLSNYIGGLRRSKPSIDIITKIVMSLNVDARWLLTGEEGEKFNKVSIGDDSEGNVAIGNHNSVGNVTTHVNGNSVVLEERVKALEALLAEKERLIKVLMEHVK